MAITGNTHRKFVSEYIAEDIDTAVTRPAFATVTVKGAGEVVDPIGLPVIFDDVDSFVLYKEASSVTAVGASPLPDGSPVGIIVGGQAGFGHNSEDVTLTPAGVPLTICYREATALNIDYALTQSDGVSVDAAPALAAKQAAFETQLELQRIVVKDTAQVANPAYTD